MKLQALRSSLVSGSLLGLGFLHAALAPMGRAADPRPLSSPAGTPVVKESGGGPGEIPGVVVLATVAGGYLASYTAVSGAVSQFFIPSDEYKAATDPELPVARPKRVLTLSSFNAEDPLSEVVQVEHVMQKFEEPGVRHEFYAFDGMDDLSKVLAKAAKKGPYDLIEIHTHGQPGALLLGDGTRITAANIEEWQKVFSGAPALVKQEAGLRFHACLLGHVPADAAKAGKAARSVNSLLEGLAAPILREGGTVVASQKVVSTLPGANSKWGRRLAEATSLGIPTFQRIGTLKVVSGDLGGWSMRPRGDFVSVEVDARASRACLKSAAAGLAQPQ